MQELTNIGQTHSPPPLTLLPPPPTHARTRYMYNPFGLDQLCSKNCYYFMLEVLPITSACLHNSSLMRQPHNAQQCYSRFNSSQQQQPWYVVSNSTLKLGTRLKHTEQYCMSNRIATHLGSNTVMPCMHTSQRVKEYHKNTHGNWQLSLRDEKKPLSSHDRQKLAIGLSGGTDTTAHALRVNRRTYRI